MPSIFSINAIALAFFLVLLLLSFQFKAISPSMLQFLLLFLLFSNGYERTMVDISIEDPVGIYCNVLAEPNARKNRNKGYRVELVAVEDKRGNISSANGIIYVVSKDSDVHIFDRIYLSGGFYDYLFIADSTEIIKRSKLTRARSRIVDIIRERTRGGDSGELMQMLLLGSGEIGSSEIVELSAKAGLRHILALSGMHLSIILFFLKPLMKSSVGQMAAFISLFLFAWLSGWKASLLRALLFLVFIKFTRDLYTSFILSAIFLLFFFPYYGFDLGAIYSFAAISGIIVFANEIGNLIPQNGIAMSIAAQIASVPISYIQFGSYQLLSIIFSFPAGMAISAFMGLAFVYLLVPRIKPIMDLLYKIIVKLFEYSSMLEPSESLVPYLIMTGTAIAIIAIRKIFNIISK